MPKGQTPSVDVRVICVDCGQEAETCDGCVDLIGGDWRCFGEGVHLHVSCMRSEIAAAHMMANPGGASDPPGRTQWERLLDQDGE